MKRASITREKLLAHIDAARVTQLPVIIHSRNADTRMAEICALK
ncbi:tatD related DNase family protein [Anaplasma phagocytophilum str. NCH-1]|uniref:TatD related DNase family protein n=1 Tax=Anaplasma phagocytophilum str. NCH-1 TaxID=1359161 RepID=A0A0F3MXN4_ANAPH|nr:tatD related DNase family protein [Anaplasma phagocytophilum str. NCH-1]